MSQSTLANAEHAMFNRAETRKISKYIAKSSGTDLVSHCMHVGEIAAQLAINLGASEFIVELVRYAGYLHDVGKASPVFQKYIKKHMKKYAKSDTTTDVDIESEKEFKGNFHNETGARFIWEFAEKFIHNPILRNEKYWKELLTRLVLDHHPRTPNITNFGQISLSEQDLTCMGDIVKDLFNSDVDTSDIKSSVVRKDVSIPSYIFDIERTNKDDIDEPLDFEAMPLNQYLTIARACLISADRIVSGSGKCEDYLAEHKWPRIQVNMPDFYKTNALRYDTQTKIISGILNSKTQLCSIKGNAGIGKTLIGLVFVLAYESHAFWALPRNAPLEGVFDTIIKTMLDCHIVNVVVEKVYAHKRHDAVIINEAGDVVHVTEDTPARITVTNIDAIVEPFGNNNNARVNMYAMMRDLLVLDEDHENTTKEGIYWADQVIAESRCNQLKLDNRIISLTATPLELFNINPGEITFLPSKGCHYPAQHKEKYIFTTADDFVPAPDTLCMSLSISQLQEYQYENAVYLHSGFLEEDLKAIKKLIGGSYGPGATGPKFCVFAGPNIQSALDYSFTNGYLMVSGIIMFLQTLGRIGRSPSGAVHHVALINPWKTNNRSAQKYIELQYDTKLSKLFYEFYETRIVGERTLDEVYALADEFIMTHQSDIIRWQKKLLINSVKTINKYLYPVRHYTHNNGVSSKDATVARMASGINMRSSVPSIFTYVKRAESNEYVGPFNVPISTAFNKNWEHAYNIDSQKEYRAWLSTFASNYTCDLDYLMSRLFPAETSNPGTRKTNSKFFEQYVKGSLMSYDASGKPLSNMYRYAETPFLVPPENMVYDRTLGLIDLVKLRNKD